MSILARDYHPRRTTWIVRRISEMIEYIWRWWHGVPLEFESTDLDTGVDVGKPFRVALRFHYDQYRIHAVLTRYVLLWGKRITAFRIVEWQCENTGKDTAYFVLIQPCVEKRAAS